MNPPEPAEEPLQNAELDSAILAMRMSLTPEETAESRAKFLTLFRDSIVAVPTAGQVPTDETGNVLPGTDISLVVAQNEEGVSVVPAFTALALLRSALPQLEHGLFLTGAQLGGILGQSPHKLLLGGPDGPTEIETSELLTMLQSAQQAAQEIEMSQQQVAQENTPLKEALAARTVLDSGQNRDAVVHAFLSGFCRIPVVGEVDGDVPQIVLHMNADNDPESHQDIPLRIFNDALPCFTSDEAMAEWDPNPRNAIALPGQVIAQLAAQAQVPGGLLINPGSPDARTLKILPDRLLCE